MAVSAVRGFRYVAIPVVLQVAAPRTHQALQVHQHPARKNADHDPFPVMVRNHGDAQIVLLGAELDARAAALRDPPLHDVEVRHDLDARHNRRVKKLDVVRNFGGS